MAGLKQILFREMELLKEGFTKQGKPWQQYQYLGDDGEHYVLFGKYELNKPYQLGQKPREYNGKTYIDWFVVPEGARGGAGVQKVMDGLQRVMDTLGEIKVVVDQIQASLPGLAVKSAKPKKTEPELPF